MKEYIEREAAISELQVNCIGCLGLDCCYCWVKAAKEHIKEVSPTDVEPVRHGEWTHRRWTTECDWGCINHRSIICSACGTEFINKEPTNYCPECGAKMNGGKNIDD